MENRSYALITLGFVAIMVLALTAAAWWLGDYGRDRVPYVVVTEGAVSGLVPYSGVRYRGVEIGQVTAVAFADDGSGDIHIRVELDRDAPVTDKTEAALRSQGLTGRAVIELDESAPGGDRLTSSVNDPARIPMRRRAGNLEEGMAELVERMTELLDDDNRQHIAGLLKNLEQSSKNLPMLLTELEHTTGSLRQLTSELERMGRAGEVSTLPRLNRLLEEWESLSRRIGDEPGGLLLGPAPRQPGPGEPGYRAPQ